MTTITRKVLAESQKAKFAALREATLRQFTRGDLLNLFGAAIRGRMQEAPYLPGKHSTVGRHNPAGTKLVRSFIRQSGGESTYWRKRYFELTGRQYNGTDEESGA